MMPGACLATLKSTQGQNDEDSKPVVKPVAGADMVFQWRIPIRVSGARNGVDSPGKEGSN